MTALELIIAADANKPIIQNVAVAWSPDQRRTKESLLRSHPKNLNSAIVSHTRTMALLLYQRSIKLVKTLVRRPGTGSQVKQTPTADKISASFYFNDNYFLSIY